jgi:hypothetical protein
MELEKQKASEMSPISRFAMSVGQPMADIARTGQKVYANVADYVSPKQSNLSDLVLDRDPSRATQVQKQVEREKQLESPYINQAGRMTGDVLLNMAMPTPDKGGVLRRTLMNLGQGAGYGAATTPENAEGGAVGGAFGSAVGMGFNRLLGGAIKPFISQDAKELAQQGIQPTIGQSIGGAFNTAEQKLKSIPFIGDVIRNSRARSVNEFNEKAIQTAVPSSKGFGDEALTTARKTLGNQYDSVLDQLPNIQVDKSAILKALRSSVDDPALALNKESKSFVSDYVRNNLINRTGQLNGQNAKKIESDFAAAIARKATGNAEDKATADAMRNVQQQWRQSLTQAADAVNPGSGAALREADAAWRAFIPLDRAGGYRGNQNAAANEVTGRFTPNSLRRSMEASDQSQFNNATRSMSGGNSPFEKLNSLTRQGERVLGDSVPDSGTAARIMMGGATVGAGTYAGMDPTTMGAGALMTLPMYSRAGSKFLSQGIEPMYQAAVKQLSLRGVPTQVLDEALRKYGPEGVISLARSAGVSSQQ